MAGIVSVRDEIPEEFASLVEAGEFWDTHDSGEYEALMTPVEVEVTDVTDRFYMAIAKDVAMRLRARARQQGVSTETLVNLWLQEKLIQGA